MLRWPLLGLRTLKASARNWKRTDSVKLNDLFSDMSNCHAEGWRRLPRRNGMVRSVLAGRMRHAGSVHVLRALREPFEAVTKRSDVPAGTIVAAANCWPLKKLPAGRVTSLVCCTQLLMKVVVVPA